MTPVREAPPSEPGIAARYSRGAMALHWLLAAAFAFQIGLGWRMDAARGPQTFAVYQLHKSVGITILMLTLLRIAWRLAHPAPAFPSTMSRLERALAQAVHIAFYGLLLGLPLTGWLLVSSSKTAVPTYLYGLVPWPHVPGVAALAPAARAGVNDFAGLGHHLLVLIAYLLIALHVAGALKHRFVDRGGDLARMLPAPRKALGGTVLAVMICLLGLFLLGKNVHLQPLAVASKTPVSPKMAAALPVPAVSAIPSPPATTTPKNYEPKPAQPILGATAPATPSVWTVRKSSSSLGFHTGWSQGAVDGRFGRWSATIRFGPDAPDASSVKVVIDMASATTGISDTESALPESDWFAVALHPTATYSASRFRHLGGNRYRVDGTLTLRGISRPLALPFTLTIAGDVATMAGTARIDRTIFGVGQGEWTATTDLPADVRVSIAFTADRTP